MKKGVNYSIVLTPKILPTTKKQYLNIDNLNFSMIIIFKCQPKKKFEVVARSRSQEQWIYGFYSDLLFNCPLDITFCKKSCSNSPGL